MNSSEEEFAPEEVEGILRDSVITPGSAILALVDLLIEKEIITWKEFDTLRSRKIAELDQVFSEFDDLATGDNDDKV